MEKGKRSVFRTVIALVIQVEHTFFEAHCRGIITKRKSGVEGFGYDPVFIPNGYDKNGRKCQNIKKGAISFRGQAVKKKLHFYL